MRQARRERERREHRESIAEAEAARARADEDMQETLDLKARVGWLLALRGAHGRL